MKSRSIGLLSVSFFLLTNCVLPIPAESQASDGRPLAQNKAAEAPSKRSPIRKELKQLIASAKTARTI